VLSLMMIKREVISRTRAEKEGGRAKVPLSGELALFSLPCPLSDPPAIDPRPVKATHELTRDTESFLPNYHHASPSQIYTSLQQICSQARSRMSPLSTTSRSSPPALSHDASAVQPTVDGEWISQS
jgi:hypothetical protein